MNYKNTNCYLSNTERSKYSNNSLTKIKMKKRRANLLRRINEIKVLSVVLLLVLVFLGMFHFSSEKIQAEGNYEKVIIGVTVKEGDTLWGYAEKYANADYYASKQEYIEEVCRLNRITQDRIYTGKTIALPVIRIPSE